MVPPFASNFLHLEKHGVKGSQIKLTADPGYQNNASFK